MNKSGKITKYMHHCTGMRISWYNRLFHLVVLSPASLSVSRKSSVHSVLHEPNVSNPGSGGLGVSEPSPVSLHNYDADIGISLHIDSRGPIYHYSFIAVTIEGVFPVRIKIG